MLIKGVLIKRLLFFTFLIPLLSCQNGSHYDSDKAYVGGQIINPKGKEIVFYKDNHVLDTVALDENNFFHLKLDSVTPGLYTFIHHEYQIFYLEPGDSLMIRVNTVDFDESLSYTGKGAARNNLLMDLFLMNENENMLIPNYYSLSPSEYEVKIDSLKEARMKLFNKYLKHNSTCSDFKEVVLANINYDYYSKKELYTSAHASNKNIKPSDFPENFYAYRDTIDFGNGRLRSYYPYYRFLNRYFDNLAYQEYKTDNSYLNRNGYEHNLNKIKIIDSLVRCDTLKNNMLRTCTRRYLINGKDAENEQSIVALFKEKNTNKAHHREISELASATMQLTPGNTLPNILLVNSDKAMKDLHSVIKRPTVLYFWSAESVKHFKNLHTRAAELKSKYPEYDFTGINTDVNFERWKDVLNKAGYDKQMEYQLENLKDAEKKLLINSMNKAIIIDANSVIMDGNTNLFSPLIEEMLLGYLNI